jgi:hypothetical protein
MWVMDERWGYARWTQTRHPIDSEVFIAADGIAPKLAAAALRDNRRVLVSEGGVEIPMHPAFSAPLVFAAGRLGTGGVVAPLDAMVVDSLGLANPLGARITPTNLGGFVGHEKSLPWGWIRAEYTDPALDTAPLEGTPPISIRAARRALQCGELAELMDSVRAPLTAGRFWDNLVGAFRRTRLVIPADPTEAEWKFCGTLSVSAFATASSSYEGDGWSVLNAVDRQPTTDGVSNGYSSQPGHSQWIELRLTAKRPVSKIVLYPRTQPAVGIGYPIDFKIQTWDGARWVDRITRSEYPRPTGPDPLTFEAPVVTDRVRIHATKLADDGDGPRLQLAEVEIE